ncbi:MAG: U32 family peptidase [Planctomycetia bacterium]|nr:U32 family peptidase [Planctomycetia bacterium]
MPTPTSTPASASATRPAPELLAPAGDWDCVRAAIENGADAVYFGLEAGFNARARAANFTLDDLPRLMQTLHLRGLRGYATLNTLVFSDELPEFARVVAAVADAGVDAVLVQDVGAARLIRDLAPDLPLHASTQMTLTSAETIGLAETLGMDRVVVARELSIAEITAIRRMTTMPLEVFVHGALCVAYSGQCLTSESLGGRSANRGQCAQACRLPYELVCDGQDVDLGDRAYLLSPQDLAAYVLAPELIAAGVSAFKIEGRLKTPEYVANITRHYRQAIDTAVAGQPVTFTPRQVEEMELSFSRGFSPGWLHGCDHKMLVPATGSAKRGVRLGTVAEVRRDRIAVDLVAGVKRGDGVAFDCGATGDEAAGGRVYEVFDRGRSLVESVDSGRVELAFAHGAIDVARIKPGQAVWKTDDQALTSRLRKSFAGSELKRRQPIDLHVTVAAGAAVRMTAHTLLGATCEVVSAEPAREATKHPLSLDTLRDQLGRLGGTPFELRSLSAEITGTPMVPFSVLGKLRHDLVARLEEAVAKPAAVRPRPAPTPRVTNPATVPGEPALPTLHILVRSLDQLGHVLERGERRIHAEFADIRLYRDAVDRCRGVGATIHLATPRIQKPDEMGIFRLLVKQAPDGILVRNWAGLRFFREAGLPVVGDFSLNVTNELTAEFFTTAGCDRMTASYDCNREQLLGLVAATSPQRLEVVVHQHMPMFHMEHCVYCAVLSPGTNKHNCGRPCDEHVVKLRDRIGVEHPLAADVGCRNTLYNAVPQSGAEVVPMLISKGVRHFRIELLEESGAEIGRVIAAYRDLLAGRTTGRDVWTALKAANRVGVTRGTLEEKRNPLAII